MMPGSPAGGSSIAPALANGFTGDYVSRPVPLYVGQVEFDLRMRRMTAHVTRRERTAWRRPQQWCMDQGFAGTVGKPARTHAAGAMIFTSFVRRWHADDSGNGRSTGGDIVPASVATAQGRVIRATSV